MSVNTLPNISKFSFYYSPLFIFIFIMLLYIFKAYEFKTWGGSFFIMIAVFLFPFMLYILASKKLAGNYKNSYSFFPTIPYASTFILLFCITSYSMTMGMMSIINNRIKDRNNDTKNENNNKNGDNNDEKDCVDIPNAIILMIFILLLINDIYRHSKLKMDGVKSLLYIALFSLSILPALATYFPIGITANENNNNSNLLFLKTYSNTICSNNRIGREFYCRDVDDGTSVVTR